MKRRSRVLNFMNAFYFLVDADISPPLITTRAVKTEQKERKLHCCLPAGEFYFFFQSQDLGLGLGNIKPFFSWKISICQYSKKCEPSGWNWSGNFWDFITHYKQFKISQPLGQSGNAFNLIYSTATFLLICLAFIAQKS